MLARFGSNSRSNPFPSYAHRGFPVRSRVVQTRGAIPSLVMRTGVFRCASRSVELIEDVTSAVCREDERIQSNPRCSHVFAAIPQRPKETKQMIQKMEFLLRQSATDLVELIKVAAAQQQSAAVSIAKAFIALVSVTGSDEEARKVLKRARVSDCTIRNARQLVLVYDDVVRPGHATEAWYDALLYTHAVEVRSAIAKVGIEKLVEWRMFDKPAKTHALEFDLIGDTGLNKTERIAKADREEEERLARIVPTLVAPVPPVVPAVNGHALTTPVLPPQTVIDIPVEAGEAERNREAVGTHDNGAATGPASPERPATTTPPAAKPTKTPMQQFEALVNGVEKFVEGMFPVCDEVVVEQMKARLASLIVKADAAATAAANARRAA